MRLCLETLDNNNKKYYNFFYFESYRDPHFGNPWIKGWFK